MPKIEDIELSGDHGLGRIRTMPQLRADLAVGAISETERRLLVDQAEILIEGLYAHLPLKRAMHAVDPLQRLRLLRHRLPELSEPRFHAELLRIFVGLRDLHTNYILPTSYGGFAFLGILVERCVEGGEPRFLVSRVFDHLVGDPNLVVGAEITHWNGTPMAIAVEVNADREAGSNEPARRARGLENMTLRTVRLSLPPDEDWVELTYRVGADVHESRIPWRVLDSADDLAPPASAAQLPAGVAARPRHLLGLDLRTELAQRAKRTLFAPEVRAEEQRVQRTRGVPRATEQQARAGVVPTTRPAELRAQIVPTAHGDVGHLRIFTFHMADGDIVGFLNEVARLLGELPREGLVLDVRGNGGGYVIAAEFLLQFLTPHRIQPEPMQFLSTRATADLCAAVDDFGAWLRSIRESVQTGAQHSSALPLYPAEIVNSVGQLYHGPVVLVTDALCYSATDIFSAGFQDHGIGPVLGVDANTGAGGANVLTHGDLREAWAGGPLRELPAGVDYRVSLRRCLRVGERFGEPVEDLGVVPDHLHDLTRRDLLAGNPDLLDAAAALLVARPSRTLEVVRDNGVLSIATAALTGIDVYADGRPLSTLAIADGVHEVPIPDVADDAVIRIEGFDGDQLVAARVV